MINVALPKGRLGEKVYSVLDRSGYGSKEYSADSRKLIFSGGGVSYFWVKPSDVGVYVDTGAADMGFIGKDILGEYPCGAYELLDLSIGKCQMCVAGKKGFEDSFSRPLKVATKFVNSARRYFSSVGREIEIVKLNGSVELAPVLGIADVIFDVVETGDTLRENGLEVIARAFPISARVIVNKSAYKFKTEEINAVAEKLKGIVNYENNQL